MRSDTFDRQLLKSYVGWCYRDFHSWVSKNLYICRSYGSHLSNAWYDAVLRREEISYGSRDVGWGVKDGCIPFQNLSRFQKIITEVNIGGTFAAIEFTQNIDQIPYKLLFDKEKFRQSPGLEELRERNMRLKSLLKQPWESKIGWINKPE
jgi:hypothetical protein